MGLPRSSPSPAVPPPGCANRFNGFVKNERASLRDAKSECQEKAEIVESLKSSFPNSVWERKFAKLCFAVHAVRPRGTGNRVSKNLGGSQTEFGNQITASVWFPIRFWA